MKTLSKKELLDDLRPEYDLSAMKGGVKGKYAKRVKAGTNIVLLSPDVAPYFPNEEAVNSALRDLVSIAKVRVAKSH